MKEKINLLKLNEIKIADNFNENRVSEFEMKQYVYSKSYYDLEFFSDYFLDHWKQKN